MTHLYLVRHGETAWHAEGRYPGQANPVLNDEGEAQAYRLAEAFDELSIDAVYTSDLARAWDTAKRIVNGKMLILPDSRWRDLSYGEWEGRRFEEVAVSDGERFQAWANDPIHVSPPGGESLMALAQRVTAAAEDICRQHTDGNVLIVTHGSPIRCLVAEWVLGGLHRISDVSTVLGGVTLMTVQLPPDGKGKPIAQVTECDILRGVRLR